MRRRLASLVFLTLIGTIGAAWVVAADVPPPPVNQTLGLQDTILNDLTESVCRSCHDGGDVSNPDRHHLNMNLPIPVGTCKTQTTIQCETDATCQATDPNDYCIHDSQAPNVTTVPPGNYECLSCHTLVWNPVTFSYEFAPFRDCLLCHYVEFQPAHPDRPQEPNVHHRTDLATARDCNACHGSFVNNTDDGHYIPTYDPSLVTPWPAGKPNGGPNGEGNCNFCHDAGGTNIVDNHDTHHGTGLTNATFPGLDYSCLACHPGHGPNHDAFDIRICEKCHGVQSLHNIQADSNGGGITPGSELAYYGHIGNSTDCWGCHGFTALLGGFSATSFSALGDSPAPYSGPVVPYIQSADVSVITAGTSAVVTLTGAAFSNFIDTPSGPINLDSTAELTAPDSSTVSLDTESVTESQMVVDVPGTLAPGKYLLRAVKGPQSSNPAILSVIPAVTISGASCNTDGLVTINGSGFSEYVNATDSGTSVSSGTEQAAILSWSDTEIQAQFSSCPASIEVSSVFGTATADLAQPPQTWGPASVISIKPQATTNIANYLFLLALPIGALLLWKNRGRKK